MARPGLLLIPSFAVPPSPPGTVVLGQKFLDGVLQYARQWQGSVGVLVERRAGVVPDADARTVRAGELPFDIADLPERPSELAAVVRRARVVSAGLFARDLVLTGLCQESGTALVYTSEYTLRTRKQIIASETSNPLLRLRRSFWTTRLERRLARAVAASQGLQCNGVPTYEAYRRLSPNALLFFDTRVRSEEVVSDDLLNRKLARRRERRPLRLIFSGRLEPMKGVEDLPAVAAELRRRGVPFELDICGRGSLAASLEKAIRERGLQDVVRLRGFLAFNTELLPFVSAECDVFVCCHPQGDPSCTYLETMSCGTPIVGYANEALLGIVAGSDAGWITPLGNPVALAAKIALLESQPAETAEAARRAVAFANQHTFERTFARRVAHLQSCSEPTLPAAGAGPARTAE